MSLETSKVTPSQASQILAAHIQADVPIMLWGKPGIGKSDLIREAAAQAGSKLITLMLHAREPSDLGGFPLLMSTEPGATPRFTAPVSLPPTDAMGPFILFLDELPAATPAMQKIAFQLVLDRAVNDYRLPAGTRVIAAGNGATDRAFATQLGTPLASRLAHYEVAVDSKDWLTWAYRNAIGDSITSFLSFRPELLFKFDPSQKEPSFPCPRTWAMLDKVAPLIPSASLAMPIVAAHVGSPTAVEFVAYLKMRAELPDPRGIWLDPDASPVPTEPSALYAISGALAAQCTFANCPKFIRYVSRYRSLEFTAMAVDAAYRRNPALIQEPDFKKWCLDHQQLFEFAA